MEESRMSAPDIERIVLAALLNDATAYWQIASLLSLESFYLEEHKVIFGAIGALANRFDPIDPASVRSEIERSGNLVSIGGIKYLAELAAGSTCVSDITYPAQVLYEYEIRRSLIDILTGTRNCLLLPDMDPITELRDLGIRIDQVENEHSFSVYLSLRDQRRKKIGDFARTLEETAGE